MRKSNASGLVRAIGVKRALSIFRDPKTSGRRKGKAYTPCETCRKMIRSLPCKFCASAAESLTG
jgi:hypothetical protein